MTPRAPGGIISTMLRALLVAVATFAAGARAQDAPFDLLLRGGQVLDGTGKPAFRADVGVRAGRIAAIGDLHTEKAKTGLDCRGLTIAPGFLDVHAHVDVEIVRHPGCDNYLRMGVTTLITGNCGGSVQSLQAHLERCEQGGVGANYGSLVGLGTVRRAVLGDQNRAPTEAELGQMQALVEQGMQAGAFGVSTGLIYVPGTFAKTDEITALAKVAARHGGVYATHMRNEGDKVLDSIAEALQIGRDAGLPVQISHLKCSGKRNWGRADEVLHLLREARAHGQRVTADQYAYDASSTGLDVLFPAVALDIGRAGFARKLRDDAGFRARMQEALLQSMDKSGYGDFSYARIASAAGNDDLVGLTIAEAAERRLGNRSRQAQAELAMDLFATAGEKRVGMIYHSMSEADVAKFLAQDWIAIAADGGLRAEVGSDKPHPRSCGNNARVLGRYVRELGVLSLPTAVQKMTSVPAKAFGIDGRGVLELQACADLVVFDAATVADGATFAAPLQPPVGIAWVVVNGKLAVDHGEVTNARAGMVLRHRGKDNAR